MNFDVYYLDDDKDLILIENQFDYENALLFLSQHNHTTLKITIKRQCEKLDHKNALKFLESSAIYSINKSKICINNEQQTESFFNKCDKCSRIFERRTSLAKHSKNCGMKRAPFDSRKQRMRAIIEQMENKLNIFERLSKDIGKLQRAVEKWRKLSNVGMNKKKNQDKNKGKSFRELFVEINMKECISCKRSFNEIAYKKHFKVCQRILNRRKPFESKKQRIINLEHAVFMRRQDLLQKKKEMMSMPNEKNRRWKKMSERFRTIMRISRLLMKSY